MLKFHDYDMETAEETHKEIVLVDHDSESFDIVVAWGEINFKPDSSTLIDGYMELANDGDLIEW